MVDILQHSVPWMPIGAGDSIDYEKLHLAGNV